MLSNMKESIIGSVEDTPFMTMAKFSEQIEQIVLKKKMDYMEAILHFCEENNLEPDEVTKFISSNLKSKIEMNAIESGYLPRKSTLPV